MALASVILSNYNGAAIANVLTSSVAAVRQQTYPDLELIIVDDGSTDESPALLRGLIAVEPRARFASTGRNRGIAAARNLGLALSRGEYLAFLDNDAVPAADWLATLVDRLQAEPTAGACASRVMFADRPDIVNSVGSVLNRQAHGMGVGMHEMAEFAVLPGELMYATGNGMIIRREALEAVGPFDEGFRYYGHDDSDMGVRLGAAGYQIVPEPRAVISHLHSFSKTQPGIRSWDDRNRLRFALKHLRWDELLRFVAVDASQRLPAHGRLGYLWAWGSNGQDLLGVWRYRRAHRRDGAFWPRQERFMQGEHGYLITPDNRASGGGFPSLQRLEVGSDDEPYLYHGWYWAEALDAATTMRWGRRVASLSFGLASPVEGLQLSVVAPPGAEGSGLEAQIRRRTEAGWLSAGSEGWQWAGRAYARQSLAYATPLAAGDYRLILVAERSYRESGEFPRELGVGLISLAACTHQNP